MPLPAHPPPAGAAEVGRAQGWALALVFFPRGTGACQRTSSPEAEARCSRRTGGGGNGGVSGRGGTGASGRTGR